MPASAAGLNPGQSRNGPPTAASGSKQSDPAALLQQGQDALNRGQLVLRGQVLIHLGRREEGKKELETAVRIDNERRAQRQKELEKIPSPEILQERQ